MFRIATTVLYLAGCIALIAANECGVRKSVSKVSEFSVGKDEFPWHLALYNNGERYVCGATLLSPTVSITAAHCIQKNSNYTLAAGKYYRELNNPNDGDNIQQTKVAKIIVHPEFNGGKPIYMFDLALLVHEQPFRLTDNVMPACFDASISSDDDLVGKKGLIAGWGYKTPNDKSYASDVLEMLEVDFKPIRADCKLKSDFETFYASDKLCAGLPNTGKAVCRGDGGGGLMYLGSDGRYYIRGILSLAPTTKGSCDYNSYALYTSASYFANYIANVSATH